MADKKFAVTFDANMDVSEVKKSVSEIQKAFNSINMSKGMATGATGTFKKLLEELDNYNSLTSQAQNSMADIKKADKSLSTILSLIEKVNSATKEIGDNSLDFIDPAELKKINVAKKAIEQAKQAISNTAIAAKKANIQQQYEEAQKKVQKLNGQIGQLNSKITEKKTAKSGIEASLEAARETLKNLKNELSALESNPVKLQTKTTSKKGVKTTENLNSEAVENYKNKLNDTKTKISEVELSISQLDKKLQGTDTSKLEGELEEISTKALEATSAMNELAEKLKHVKGDSRAEAISKLRDELADLTGTAKKDLPQSIDKLEAFVNGLSDIEKAKVGAALEKIRTNMQQVKDATDKGARSLAEATGKVREFSRTAQDIENLKDRILDFFSISNTVQIFKDAVRDAFETVKELDAAMTETAVVTDFSIGDMWDKLPQYSEEATKLGASIKSLYEATTLYYQQGLNSEQAMSVGIETMKMARIANMNAATATEAMTAALRGFNMEINETSATRINDVYSELAAITAADTSQIATAMSKTASIASSANMEFETTAALLAQIIETTQEAPETAGTAMKTIIARFTEVKQLFSEGMLTGKDSEGEEININKIDAALKTVGISLSDFLNGTKGIDDIFLELASKWDTLDLATQRYIATTAAGSRQQSRFLAMMSNYDRTMELVNAATNSAGASQKQFNKTTESLEAKLQKLKNAWAEFTMGLANNDAIKFGVDLLTKLLETVNKITGIAGTDGFGGLVTMVLRLGTVLMGLKSGEGVINGLLKTLKNAGITDLLGMKAEENSKINLLGVLGKTGKHAGNDIAGILEILKDPATRGDALKEVGASFKTLGVKIGGAAKAVLGFLKVWGGWITLATAIVFAITKIVKAFNTAQKETKLAGLQENLSQLDEAAQDAKDTLESIGQDRKNLKKLNDELEDLTKGTMEWRQALIETNKEVLGLIEKYDFLADYVDYGTDGQLIIKEEGWETLIDKQQQIITNITGERIATQLEITQLERNIDFENLVVEAYVETRNEEGEKEGSDFQAKAADFMFNWADFMDEEAFWGFTWGDLMAITADASRTSSSDLVPSTTNREAHKQTEEQGGYQAVNFKSHTGLVYKDLSKIASAMFQGGIIAEDGISKDEKDKAFEIFKQLFPDADESIFEVVMQAANRLGKQFDELGASAANFELRTEQLLRNFVNNAVFGNNNWQNVEWADAGSELIYQLYYKDQDINTIIANKIEELKRDDKYTTDGQYDAKKVYQAYADEKGYFYDGNKTLYTDSSMTTVVPATEEGMLKALATSSVMSEINGKMTQLVDAFSGKPGASKLFDSIFSQEGSEITSAQIAQYYKNGVVDEKALLEGLGFSSAKELYDKTGIVLEDLVRTADKNFELAKERIKNERIDVAARMASHNKTGWNTPEFNAAMLSAFELKFGEDFRYILDNVMSSFEGTGDEVLADKGYQLFQEAAMERSATEVTELADFINSIDWSDPIAAAHALNQEIEYGSGITQEYATQLMKVDSSFLSASSQMQHYFNSDEFKEVNAELTEMLELNGEITATDVQSLTGKYSKLNKMLKNTGMSAAALAKTLNLIAKGKLKINQLTEPVIALLKNFDSLGNIVSETLEFISNFDAGPDENQAAGFLKTGSETILGNLAKGAYGNSQNYSYLNTLFPGWDEGLTPEQRVAEMERLGKKMEANSENMLNMWTDLANGKNIWGEDIDKDWLEQSGIDVNRDGNEIVLTGYEGKTTEELVAWISEAYGVSNQMAKLMLTDFKNYSEDLAYELMQNDFNAGIKKAAQELKTWTFFDPSNPNADVNGLITKKIISESEISAMMATSGQSREAVLEGLGGEENLVITDFREANGELKETAKVLDDIAKKSGYTDSKKMMEFYSPNGVFSINTFQKNMGTWGLTETEQKKVIEDYINAKVGETGKGITIEAVLPDGTVKQLTDVKSYADYEQKYNVENQQHQAEVYGKAIGEAVANALTNINLEVDPEQLKNSIITVVEEAGKTTKLALGLDETALNAMGGTIQQTLDGESPTVGITGYLEYSYPIPATVDVPARLVYDEDQPGGGEEIGSNAKGTKNSPSSYPSLVSEEGPELIQKANGTAYLTGQNGPEIVQIDRGDTVYTAKETEQIFKKRAHTIIPRFAGGGGAHAYGGVTSKVSGGSSPGKEEEDKWENPFDKLYNLVRKIDEELRQRERIERRYEKLLEGIDASASKIVKVSREELAQLERERMLQERLASGRRDQISKYQSENADLTKYGNVVQNDRGEDVLRINWDLINSVTDSEQGQRIEEYISQLEEWFDSLEEVEDALWEIEDAVEEIKERGKEEYFELEDAIKEALAQSYQDEIDKLSEINDSINDTNSSLLDTIQKSIDKQRQNRDNQRIEDDLAEKQRRLLYLQQDTSGANAMEILQLQKEIEEGQEDYTDTLIDQKITELQEQNDEAAKQREQQINLLQSQLDHYIETGRIWNDVYALMGEGLNKDTGLVRGSRLEEILKSAEGYKGMSEIAKMEWMNDTNNMIAQALAYLEIGRRLEDIGTQAGSQIEFTTSDGRVLTGTVNDDGSVTASDGQTYNNVFQGYDGKYYAGENIADTEEPVVESAGAGSGGFGGGSSSKNNPYGKASSSGDYYYANSRKTTWGGDDVRAIQWALQDMGYDPGTIDGGYGYSTWNAVMRFQRAVGITADGDYGPRTKEQMRLKGYKTGGLADFTGPAWLDGTKARPELVLNAKDTQNFIQLKDILASVLERGSASNTSAENNGDITYDIDINVESIGSDYDVEQVANKVKSMIGENARYRNNNTVSLAR